MTKLDILPQDIEAERALLCSLLLRGKLDILKADLEKINETTLDENDFFDERNAVIYTAIRDLILNSNTIPDPVILKDYIEKHKLKVSPFYAMELPEYLPAPVNIKEYAQIIKRKSILRKIQLKEAQIRILIQEDAKYSDILKLVEEVRELTQKLNLQDRKNNIKQPYKEDINTKIKTVCNNLFPVGYLSLLAGPSGIGKTYAAINLSCSFVMETNKKAFLWLSEDLGQVGFRIETVLQNIWTEKADKIRKNLFYMNDTAERFLTKEFGTVRVDNTFLNWFKLNIVEKYDFIVLDPLIAFFGGNENDSGDARLFMDTASKMVMGTNKVILILHHTNKTVLTKEEQKDINKLRNSMRGSSAFLDAARTACYLRKIEFSKDKREIVVIKSNIGRTGYTSEVTMPFNKNNQGRSFYGSEAPV